MKKILFLAIATLFITATFAQQRERIIRFHSDIKIETDDRIEVAELIRIYADGNEIKRGIVRELPLYRENDKRKQMEVLWEEYGNSISGLTGALICLLFFFVTLITAGKRPKKPVAIPTFTPPRKYSLLYSQKV